MQKERSEMYDDVFSELREQSDSLGESLDTESETNGAPAESDGGRYRVLTPRQRARLHETSAILYLG
jgi:hypothetical protein